MSSICWSCNLETSAVFCEHCKVLQAPSIGSAYDRLSMSVTFDVDMAVLEANYFNAQKQVHPDRFVAASKTEKLYSAQHSAAVNEAYAILKDPVKRTQELLKIAGHILPNIEQQTLDDPELLMEVIELREALIDIENISQLKDLQDKIERLFQDNIIVLSQAFKNDGFDNAAKLLNRLRYLNKIRLEANQRRVV